MLVYRTQVHGHLIEARRGPLGGETVLLNGRVISYRPLAGWTRGSHFFDVTDEQGRARHVEVQWIDVSKLGLGKYRVTVRVDGVERARLEPIDPARPIDVCYQCGYPLKGLPIVHGEIRCPECGRHTLAAFIGNDLSEPGAADKLPTATGPAVNEKATAESQSQSGRNHG
ncbi:MAG: hypothetical protein HRU76_15385 [Phycisphaeraceae bacterium]|nr:hypothetical protein [Phycisphaerales bacterium]QOJ18885.1 MAG: hypothetical protein HRU76_15385 [Phycisphaeraceae bacterium]